MPIIFNAEHNAWEPKDLTPEEETSLMRVATDVIVDYFGEVMAQRIMKQVHIERNQVDLKDIEPENMGTA